MPKDYKDADYEWDKNKAKSNLEKHGLPFQTAFVFNWDLCRQIFEDVHSIDEDRWIAIGYGGTKIVTIVYTDRGRRKRIISVRDASRTEAKEFKSWIKKILTK